MREQTLTAANKKNKTSGMARRFEQRGAGQTLGEIAVLQRTAGNRAVLRLLQSGALQAELRLSRPHDIYEQEADRVADEVMRMSDLVIKPKPTRAASGNPSCRDEEEIQTKPVSQRITPPIQRQAEEPKKEQEEEKPIQTKSLSTQDITSLQRQAEKTEEEAETAEVSPRCGPEMTDWLINQMNANQNHPVIRTGREHRWPRWIPFFNIGWTVAALYDFAQLVKPGGPWDFKRTQRWWRVGEGRSCPTGECDRTVTLCGHCVNYDVPGNIHFGWVGRRMELAPWALHTGAGIVQEGGAFSDDTPDIVAIDIGIAMADEGKFLCDEVSAKLNQLNLDRTGGCSTCNV